MVRNQELTLQILDLLREGRTQKEIAIQLRKHRNTVYRHVKRIRDQKVYSVNEVVNKIDNKLTHDINVMLHSNLIAYRRVLSPSEQKTTIEGGQKPIVVKMWKPEDEPAE